MTSTDNTLTPSTIAALASDGTYTADTSAAAAIGQNTVAAVEAAEQQERDAAAWRAANGWA